MKEKYKDKNKNKSIYSNIFLSVSFHECPCLLLGVGLRDLFTALNEDFNFFLSLQIDAVNPRK
jgi:hypothetical protein